MAVVCAHRQGAGSPEPVQLGRLDCLRFDFTRWNVSSVDGSGVVTDVERAEVWISCPACLGSRSLNRRQVDQLAAAQWSHVEGTEHEGRAVAMFLLDDERRRLPHSRPTERQRIG